MTYSNRMTTKLATKAQILANLHSLESRMTALTVAELNERRDCEIALGMTDAKYETVVQAATRVSDAIKARAEKIQP